MEKNGLLVQKNANITDVAAGRKADRHTMVLLVTSVALAQWDCKLLFLRVDVLTFR